MFLTSTTLLFSNPGFSATTIGGFECGTVLSSDKKSTRWTISDWFYGFLSGMNVANGESFVNKIPGEDSIYFSILNYCKENPLSDTQRASLFIYNTLK